MTGWKSWADRQRPRRVLLVKTSSAIYLREALSVLRRELPGTEIILWTEERESSEFYQHPAVARVVLYRDVRVILPMLRELRSLEPYLVVTQRTDEPTYDKMRLFAWTLLGGPGLVLDDSMRVIRFGGWPGHLLTTVVEVLAGLVRGHQAILRLGKVLGKTVISLGSLLAAPIVLLALLGGAARIEIQRHLGNRRSSDRGRAASPP